MAAISSVLTGGTREATLPFLWVVGGPKNKRRPTPAGSRELVFHVRTKFNQGLQSSVCTKLGVGWKGGGEGEREEGTDKAFCQNYRETDLF